MPYFRFHPYLSRSNLLIQIGTFASGWGIYDFVMQSLNLVLVYMVFQLLVVVANQKGANDLARGTTTLFKMYMVVMITALILPIFSTGFVDLAPLAIFTTLLALVFEIVFLVWLLKFRQLEG